MLTIAEDQTPELVHDCDDETFLRPHASYLHMNSLLELRKIAPRGTLIVRITGSVDEYFGKVAIPASGPATLDIICDGVTSMNSAGANRWICYFEELRKRGHKIRFLNLSPVMIQLIAMNIPLAERNEIISLQIPLYCSHCGLTPTATHSTSSGIQGLRKFNEESECGSCGHNLIIDDIFQDYVAVQTKNTQADNLERFPSEHAELIAA